MSLILPPGQGPAPGAAELTLALSDVIRQWTTISPMTIEDIVASIAFTTGYAIGNRPREDRIRLPTKTLREMAIDRMQRGIDEAVKANGNSTIVMPTNTNKIGIVS